MGLPAQTCFGYDRALGWLKTHVLYELREKRWITGPVVPDGGDER